MNCGDMSGRVALVTGGGSGLGRASAKRLAEAGAKICIVDVNEARLKEAEEELKAVAPEVLAIHADLSQADACKAAVASCVSHFQRLDALCHAAGLIRFSHTPDMAESDYLLIQNVNLAAAFFLSQAAIPHLLEVDGTIVNVASSAAFIGEAYAAAYCASKAGLVAMTKAMAMEYMHQSIRINAVAPGGMMTGLVGGMAALAECDRELIGRIGSPRGLCEIEDVAETVVFLATPAARSYHGACINIDAGVTAD